MRTGRLFIAAFCVLLAGQMPAGAVTINVMMSGGFSVAYNSLATDYQKKSGNTLVTVQGPSMGADPTAVPARLARGEPADVVVIARSALDTLVAAKTVLPDGVADLGLGRIAMAVKAGAPKPDISTVDAFKRTLLNAKSAAYSDSASGVYLSTVLFKQLGIEKEMAAKSKMIQATPVGLNIARGEYEIGFQQLSELKPVPGIDIVGLIPDAVQQVTPFSAGLVAKSPHLAEARDLIRFLASPAAYSAIRASGMEPAQERK